MSESDYQCGLFPEEATTLTFEVFQAPIWATQAIRNLHCLNNACKFQPSYINPGQYLTKWCTETSGIFITSQKVFSSEPISSQCFTYEEARQLVFTCNMYENQQWKSDILSKDATHQPAS